MKGQNFQFLTLAIAIFFFSGPLLASSQTCSNIFMNSLDAISENGLTYQEFISHPANKSIMEDSQRKLKAAFEEAGSRYPKWERLDIFDRMRYWYVSEPQHPRSRSKGLLELLKNDRNLKPVAESVLWELANQLNSIDNKEAGYLWRIANRISEFKYQHDIRPPAHSLRTGTVGESYRAPIVNKILTIYRESFHHNKLKEDPHFQWSWLLEVSQENIDHLIEVLKKDPILINMIDNQQHRALKGRPKNDIFRKMAILKINDAQRMRLLIAEYYGYKYHPNNPLLTEATERILKLLADPGQIFIEIDTALKDFEYEHRRELTSAETNSSLPSY